MRGIYKDHIKLGAELVPFFKGQFQLEMGNPENPLTYEVYRGETVSAHTELKKLPNTKWKKERYVHVELSWLCKRKVVGGPYDHKETRWEKIPAVKGRHFVNFRYNSYDTQPDENRLKLYGDNEICRFYLCDDHTNLVVVDNEYIPYYTRERARELKITMLALLFPKKYKLEKK